MKTLLLSFALGLLSLTITAQNNYEQAMQDALEAFGQARSMDDMLSTATKFEQIAEVATNEWLPGYYAAMIYCITNYWTQDVEQKNQLLEKAQKITDGLLQLAPEESEVYTLQGMVYQAMITLDPMNNGQIYSGKSNGAFQTALKLNPNNPRPYYLQALTVFHTPEEYGGGKKAAQPLLAEAMEYFEKEEPKGEFYPDWGKEDCARQLDECNKVE